jgi:ribosome biogenesis GTPase
MAWEGGATPVILLNKEDLAEDPGQTLGEIEAAAPGVEVVPVSCYTGSGIEWVASRVSTGRTAVLVGPSGTGKSTLINTLLGEERLETGTIRDADKRGRHTTTSRQLVSLPSGGMLIDTPGLRELQLWADSDALADAFSDIAEFARACRFRDCTHSGEPGCAVQSALADGALDHARYENFLELGKELAYLERRTDDRVRQENTRRWKQINKQMRGFTKERRAGGDGRAQRLR